MKQLKISFLLLLLTFLVGCKHDAVIVPEDPALSTPINEGPCDPNLVYFQNDVLPILISNCAFSGCHDAGTASDGVILTNYDSTMNSGEVNPGNPNGSDLFTSLSASGSDRMPRNLPPLKPDQIETIRAWIAAGALNSSCVASCDTNNVTFTLSVAPIIQNNCEGCHRAASLGGGIALDSYAAIRVEAISRRLLDVVEHKPYVKAMPLGGNKLPQCEIDVIRIWIDAGAPNN